MNAMRIPHIKSCPCEECAGVYERPVLDDEEEREKGRVRCTQDGCPGGKIRNPHTRRCIKVSGHIYDKVCTGGSLRNVAGARERKGRLCELNIYIIPKYF